MVNFIQFQFIRQHNESYYQEHFIASKTKVDSHIQEVYKKSAQEVLYLSCICANLK